MGIQIFQKCPFLVIKISWCSKFLEGTIVLALSFGVHISKGSKCSEVKVLTGQIYKGLMSGVIFLAVNFFRDQRVSVSTYMEVHDFEGSKFFGS